MTSKTCGFTVSPALAMLLGTRAGWKFLGKAVFHRRMLIYQESVFNTGASDFMQFLAQDEISGQTLRERKGESLKWPRAHGLRQLPGNI